MTTIREKLVLVGNGMAGIGTIEQILKLGGAYDITVLEVNLIPITIGSCCLMFLKEVRPLMISS